jgi:drug/metabolite transporter (DMT)-like permease
LALGGMVVVLKTPDSPWPVPESFADALGLLGGLSFAMVNIMLRKLRNAPPVANALAMFGGGGLGCLVAALVGMQFGMVQAVPALATPWVVGVLLLTVAIIIANSTLQYGASRLPANTTSIIMLLEVVFASVSSVWLGAGLLTTNTLIGGALIFAACIWSAMASAPPPAPDALPAASP